LSSAFDALGKQIEAPQALTVRRFVPTYHERRLNDDRSKDSSSLLGDTDMINASSTPTSKMAAATPEQVAATKQIVLNEIEVKWNKFSKQDLSALKNKDDLVTQVVAKYGLEKVTAQRDVDALLKGRAI
jgi:hypothetical protein